MSTPNSVHNTLVNSEHEDDYVEDLDPITRTSKSDVSDPLHLHPNDSSALTMVSIKLKGTENYQVWSCAMLLALEMKNKTVFIDWSCKRSKTDEILGRQEVLPDVRSAYPTISSEESHRVASSSVSGSSQRGQTSAFVSNMPNKSNFQRNDQSFNIRPRPNNMNNNRQNGGSGLVCEKCGFNGHTIDRCFKTIRPDIMFSVYLCARFQEAPKISHLEAVNSIFRYIKDTMHLGLWYPKGTSIETVVYVDSKQIALAISTTEAEYVSVEKACQQALWMKQALIDYDVRLDDVPIMCDNKSAIDLSKNPVKHSRTKHIKIRYHFLRDNVQKGHISIEKVPSVDNIADILTKPLKRESFNYLRLGLGMMEHIP
uniref:Retrovirus-related Pol polyprotein from transposon TNT 1-94 n=1 Tax=Tanacetum cinerariifolium TaxID=118510 RepID=A0A6L2N8H7_TANCI|nr:retrovirus-related Pol polyprotein from transposon TNT 1-94 [Tanacetum cinerariifolium]